MNLFQKGLGKIGHKCEPVGGLIIFASEAGIFIAALIGVAMGIDFFFFKPEWPWKSHFIIPHVWRFEIYLIVFSIGIRTLYAKTEKWKYPLFEYQTCNMEKWWKTEKQWHKEFGNSFQKTLATARKEKNIKILNIWYENFYIFLGKLREKTDLLVKQQQTQEAIKNHPIKVKEWQRLIDAAPGQLALLEQDLNEFSGKLTNTEEEIKEAKLKLS